MRSVLESALINLTFSAFGFYSSVILKGPGQHASVDVAIKRPRPVDANRPT